MIILAKNLDRMPLPLFGFFLNKTTTHLYIYNYNRGNSG